MPSLTAKDRISLCLFSYEDGRQCRTPRLNNHPHFCFYHAQKEAQSQATESIADDLAYFFSSDYLSANDLNTALGRVFVAVARGDLKPRAARTLAYLAQTMFQTLHLAQNEFITACGEKDWRQTVVKSINANQNYRFHKPAEPSAQPAPPQSPAMPTPPPQAQNPLPTSHCHAERSETPHQVPAKPTTADTHPNPKPSPVSVQSDPPPPSTPTPAQPQPTPPSRRQIQTPDHYAVHYGPEYRLTVGGKPV